MQNTIAQNNDTANNAIANAMKAATNVVKEGNPPKTTSNMHTILIRRDVQNKPVVFLPETYSKVDNKISYWSGEKGGSVQETTADYYFTSKPADPELTKEMTGKYATRFNAKEILVRQRLYKEVAMRKSLPEKEGDELASRREFADKLVAALTKAIYEAVESK